MNDYFKRQTNRTYILFSLGTLILTEVIFGFAWDGGYNKSLLAFSTIAVFCFSCFIAYFFFKNLLKGNRGLKGGLSGGITTILVVFAFLFSLGMLSLLLEI